MDMRTYKLPKEKIPKINDSVRIYRVMFPLRRKPFKMIINKIKNTSYERQMNIIAPYGDALRLIPSDFLAFHLPEKRMKFSNKEFHMVYYDIITIGNESAEEIAKFYIERAFNISNLSEKYDIEISKPFISRVDLEIGLKVPSESYNQSARYERYIGMGVYADEIELNNPTISKVELGDKFKFAVEKEFNMFRIYFMECTQINITNEGIRYTFVSRDNSCTSLYLSLDEVKEKCSNYKEVKYHE